MTGAFDMVIRGGLIVDGTGGEPFLADVGIRDAVIAEVGAITAEGRQEIDARGLLVTPGFVDIHTHYDGQVTWEHQLSPSSEHGVTTVLMGNCGVGFAPCRPEDRAPLVRLMEGVEDLPEAVLTAGLPWNWVSFQDYLDRLGARAYDIDITAQVPHAPLRVYVMGERALRHEAATPDDIARMAQIAREGIEAGALGFSTSRSINHRASDGNPTPSLKATEAELTGIALGLKAAGKGVLQLITDFPEPIADELGMIERIVEASGRPLSLSLLQYNDSPSLYRTILDWLARCNARGLPILAQVAGRSQGALIGLELTSHPFTSAAAYQEIAHLPLEQRIAEMKKPEVRARILDEEPPAPTNYFEALLRDWTSIFPLTDPPMYEPDPEQMVGARAAATGVPPRQWIYDYMVEERGILLAPAANFAGNNFEAQLEMMRDDHTILGLGDGGAHLGLLCDASLPTHMIAYWTRDRTKGDRLPLAQVVKALSNDTARAVGLADRGVVAPGYKADLNIIDYERILLRGPRISYDLPAGGRRVTQDADGYVATIVAGDIVRREGRATGALPGRLVRGAQAPARVD